MRKLTFLALLAVAFCTNRATMADIILNYEGQLLDTVVTGTALTSSDRITGTIVFDNFLPLGSPGTFAAKSFTLSTTVGGLPGFQFTVADAATDPRVTLNAFDFAPGSLTPTAFGLTVSGEEFGGIGDEELSISDIGDLATIDFLEATESAAFNTSEGSFTAVPEPGSIALLSLLACAGIAVRNRRNT
jgi:hypothetical protein